MLLSSESRTPKYAQIADVLRQRIARGRWPRETQLPTNEELAAEFGVSRVTVRQAIDLLSRSGMLEARQGRGTFVTGSLSEDRWLRVETSLSALAEVYRDTSPEIINIAEADTQPLLEPSDGHSAERYISMRRVHSRNSEPYCVIRIFLDETIFRQAPERFRRELVIPILARLSEPEIAHARQTLTIGAADLDESRLLRIPLNAPVAEVRRVLTTHDNYVIYLGEVTYRGDYVRIEMDLKP
jgi:GntR family transcriptional regulator